MEKKGNSS